ncbi:conserved hypothetical protein [Ricinus communis]|uniref:Uncharacterized protein n=1 Tax=Ricinus communis TaxID=3988 RepID=B9RWX3_RICCO|nr:conserved hypothetical protein [Ricinus communis]
MVPLRWVGPRGGSPAADVVKGPRLAKGGRKRARCPSGSSSSSPSAQLEGVVIGDFITPLLAIVFMPRGSASSQGCHRSTQTSCPPTVLRGPLNMPHFLLGAVDNLWIS